MTVPAVVSLPAGDPQVAPPGAAVLQAAAAFATPALSAATGQDPAESAFIARYLQAHSERAWMRDSPWHVTVSVVVSTAGPAPRVLLGRHPRWGWKQFGGHLEPGDAALDDAARRELAEEAGPHIAALADRWRPVTAIGFFGPMCSPPPYGDAAHLDVCLYAVVPAAASGPHPRTWTGPEGMPVAWFLAAHALQLVDAGAAAMIRAALDR